jgi:hypothetical protein
MSNKLPKGGHAPRHLREAFLDLICADDGELSDEEIDGGRRDLHWLCGRLWNCNDILPGYACHTLFIPRGSSYAQAARMIRREELEHD